MPATCASSSPATPGDRGQVGALAEHGDGARDRRGLARQAREPQQHGARDGARADRAHDVGVRGVGLDRVGLERVQQLAHEQRVAAGGPVAGLAERAVGLGAEPAGDELRRRPPRDSGPGRTWAVAGSLAISASSAASVGGSPVRTRRGDEHRLALEPPHQVGEEAQRRAVAPVQVVDLEQQRALGGEVERQPVEAVQGGEGGVAAAGAPLSGRWRRRRGRRAAAPASASGSATTASKSWRTTPNGNSRSSSPARALSTSAPSAPARRRNSDSRRDLPIPGGPSIRTARPSPSVASSSSVSSSATSRSRSTSEADGLRLGRRGGAARRAAGLVAQQLLVQRDERGAGRAAELLAQQHADVLVDAQRLVDVAAGAQDLHQRGARGLAERLRLRRRRGRPARPRARRRRRAWRRRRRASPAPRRAGRPARRGGRRSTAPRGRAAGRARRSRRASLGGVPSLAAGRRVAGVTQLAGATSQSIQASVGQDQLQLGAAFEHARAERLAQAAERRGEQRLVGGRRALARPQGLGELVAADRAGRGSARGRRTAAGPAVRAACLRASVPGAPR